MAEIARLTTLKDNRVMFIIHRKEVLEQVKDTFKKQGVKMDLTTMGMVQTLTRRIKKLPTPTLILIDEAHHALAKSYINILKSFPNAYVLLFTATPKRTGHKQLDQIADDIIVGQSIKELTKKGFLAPFKYYSVPYDDVDFKKLKRNSTGDYTQKSMDNALNSRIYGHVVENYQKLASDKQAVVYTYSIKSAKKLADEFNKNGINAAELDGKSSKDQRNKIVKDFKNQKIQVLVNVDLFTEGIDLPNTDCVVMVRPTESLSLYMQFSMRCLNPRKDKTAIIIDHVANYQRFGLPNADRNWKKAIITTDKRKRTTNDNIAIVTCPNCYGVLDKSQMVDNTCYLCGFSPVVVKKQKEVVNTKLQEIDQVKAEKYRATKKRLKKIDDIIHNNVLMNVTGKSIGQLQTYKEFEAYAELHGYNKHWAYIMFKTLKGK